MRRRQSNESGRIWLVPVPGAEPAFGGCLGFIVGQRRVGFLQAGEKVGSRQFRPFVIFEASLHAERQQKKGEKAKVEGNLHGGMKETWRRRNGQTETDTHGQTQTDRHRQMDERPDTHTNHNRST